MHLLLRELLLRDASYPVKYKVTVELIDAHLSHTARHAQSHDMYVIGLWAYQLNIIMRLVGLTVYGGHFLFE